MSRRNDRIHARATGANAVPIGEPLVAARGRGRGRGRILTQPDVELRDHVMDVPNEALVEDGEPVGDEPVHQEPPSQPTIAVCNTLDPWVQTLSLLVLMGSKGHVPPPSHLRRPPPGPDMLHPDPFGPGIHPPPGAFPFDMMPHPDIMEQKFAAQDVEMRRLLTENQRLAATHTVLRQELAAAQQELQRLHAHMGAIKADQEQHMRGLLDNMAKMETDLKASETIKVELQQAHAEAQSLVTARQELMAKVQQLTQDLQKSHGDGQQIPALMSELDSLRQEYQHCRTTFDYERKLRIDHYESLQVMEKNYMSMVREVEKLRAELTNTANLDKSGGSYSNSGGYKENDTTGQRSVGQNAYEDVYGLPQPRGLSGGGAVTYGGGPTGTPPNNRPVYDASKNPSFDTTKIADTSGYENPRVGSLEPPKGIAAAANAAYDPANKGAGGAQLPASAANVAGQTQTASPYGSVRAPSPYGSTHTQSPYGSTQAPNSYGSVQAQNPYGSAQGPNHYGSAQAPNPYGSTQAPNPYGSTQAPNPYGSAQGPKPYGSAQVPNPYGSAHAPNPYGTAQGPSPYGSIQGANPYGSAQVPNTYGSAQAPNVSGTGYDALPRGSSAGGNTRR